MNKKGFTLIELLVVVLIVGILAAIALPQYLKVVEKSRASEALSVLGAMAAAVQRLRTATVPNQEPAFELLDVTFHNHDGTPAAGKVMNTKSFIITLHADRITAVRNTSAADKYTITKEYKSGRMTCSGPDAKNICAGLGLKAG